MSISNRFPIIFLFTFATVIVQAQDDGLPYHVVPSSPEKYSAGALASRMIDGLGFRLYWATKGLRPEDIAFKPGKDSRTCLETMEHIYDLSVIIVNATMGRVNNNETVKLSFEDLKKKTLENLETASAKLRSASENDIKTFVAKFKNGDKAIEYPFWSMVNGPIEDCVWHAGQIVTLRRLSGNPINEKVNFFTGTLDQ
jgi:hypothetical protein